MAPTLSPGNLDTNVQALLQAFAMIIVSEIGDKTFLIAAILAMRHPRLTVFIGAFGSLVVMSVLSAVMGHLLPTLIPRSWTQFAASVLFIFFGVKMLLEAKEMKSGNEKIQEELREAEKEIKEDEEVSDGIGLPSLPSEGLAIQLEEMEGGRSRSRDHAATSPSSGVSDKSRWAEGARNFCSLFLGPVFVQAFVLTFLGEWGDRSQIATIALAAAHNIYLVIIGTIVGHASCTALAVIGGRYVSTKISVKHVTYGGSILFLLFGIIYLCEAFAATTDVMPMAPENGTPP